MADPRPACLRPPHFRPRGRRTARAQRPLRRTVGFRSGRPSRSRSQNHRPPPSRAAAPGLRCTDRGRQRPAHHGLHRRTRHRGRRTPHSAHRPRHPGHDRIGVPARNWTTPASEIAVDGCDGKVLAFYPPGTAYSVLGVVVDRVGPRCLPAARCSLSHPPAGVYAGFGNAVPRAYGLPGPPSRAGPVAERMSWRSARVDAVLRTGPPSRTRLSFRCLGL